MEMYVCSCACWFSRKTEFLTNGMWYINYQWMNLQMIFVVVWDLCCVEYLGSVNPRHEIYTYMCGMRLLMFIIMIIWDDGDVFDNVDMRLCWYWWWYWDEMMLMLMMIMRWDDVDVDNIIAMRWCWCWWWYWDEMMLILIMTLRWDDVDVDNVIVMDVLMVPKFHISYCMEII